MKATKKLVFTGLFIALGVVLPVAFHAVPDAGRVFQPMYLPVFLCGLVCGWPYGLVCGALTPLLSSLITSMPPAALLPAMIVELAVYGAASGLLIRMIRTKSTAVNVVCAVLIASLAGRVVNGILQYLVFSAGSYTLSAWVTASFIRCLPGIAILVVFAPVLVIALEKAKLIAPQQAAPAK